jgi:hypothetical protein
MKEFKAYTAICKDVGGYLCTCDYHYALYHRFDKDWAEAINKTCMLMMQDIGYDFSNGLRMEGPKVNYIWKPSIIHRLRSAFEYVILLLTTRNWN